MLKAIQDVFKQVKATFLLMVGVPDYDAYVEHQRSKHPDRPVMTYEEFFRERQQSRYNGRTGKCC